MLFAQNVRSIKEDVNVPPALSDLLRIPSESLEVFTASGDLTTLTCDPEVTQVTTFTAKILSSMASGKPGSTDPTSTSSSSVMSSAKDWFFTSKLSDFSSSSSSSGSSSATSSLQSQVKSAFGSGSGMGASGGSDFGLYGSGAGRGDSLRNMNTWMPTSM